MEAKQVIRIRDTYGNDNLTVVCDNVYYFNTRVDNIIWDDANEMLYAVRGNEDYHSNDTRPIKIEAVPYEQIQYMNCTNNRADAKKIMLALGYTADQADKIILKVAPIDIERGMMYDNKNTFQP